MSYFIYILASRRNGTLYVGITRSLGRRVWQHRQGLGSDFVFRYGVFMLVWSEAYENVIEAIGAEKRIKRWRRAWKIELIERSNPEWRDLLADVL